MEKPKPRKLWFNQMAPDLPIKGDPITMRRWLGVMSGRGAYFCLHSNSTGSWSGHVKSSTVEKAIKKKHLDMECWVYANRLKAYRIWVKLPNGGTIRDTKWVADSAPINWVLDMDRVPDIAGGTPKDRIDSLLKKFKRFKCPDPLIVVETSPCSFHVVYGGTAACEWTKERRYAVALLASGYRGRVVTMDDRDAVLKAGGVDPSYMRQNIEFAKFRLPGSVNIEKSCGTLDAIGKAVVAFGWYNHQYKAPSMKLLAELDAIVPPKKDKAKSATPKDFPDAAWKRFVPFVRDALSPLVRPDMLELLSEYISKNYNFLQKGKCRILQVHMAEALRVEQWAISRLIKMLKECGVLVQTADYIQKKKAKSYGSGLVLKHAFEQALLAGREYDIEKPYEDGAVNDHLLEDLRYLARIRTPVDDAVQIIMEKQEHRPRGKKRSAKDIARAYVSWLNRTQHSEDLAG